MCDTYSTLAESPLKRLAAWSILASASSSARSAAGAKNAVDAHASANPGLKQRLRIVLRGEPVMAW